MSVKETLEKLALLQRLNDKIELCKKDREVLSVDVRKAEEELEELKQELEDLKHDQMEAQKKADACETKISEAEDKNEKLQVELNTITNQKQYDAVSKQIKSNQADIQQWEDQELEALDKVDEIKTKRDELKAQTQQKEKELEELRADVAEERRQYDEQLEDLTSKKKSLRNGVPDDVLESYERIAGSLEGNGLAEVRNRVCQGCFTTVTKQTENELMRGEEIVYCNSCGRMLKLADSEV